MISMRAVHLVSIAVALAAPSAGALAQTRAETAAKLAAGVWGYVGKDGKLVVSGSFTGAPPDSALLPEAIAARKAFDFRSDDPIIGCGAPGMPRALTAASPMTFTWAGDDIEIRYESMDVRRTVKMTSAQAPARAARTPNGYSTGRWDGETLVVTTSLLDARVVDMLGTPKSDAMTLEERYRVEEADGATYLRLDLTITDPKTFRESYPWHFDFVLRRDWELMDYECEERPAELTPGLVR
jgi:hypothetical protein